MKERDYMMYQSKRLTLIEYKAQGLDLFYSVFSNKEVMKYAFLPRYESKEDILPYFESVLKNNENLINRPAYEFGIYLTEDNKYIGHGDIEVHYLNQYGGCGEIGYFILPEYWGSGYATEVAELLIAISFENINLHRVSASCNSKNLPSENIMKKLGMQKEGVARKVRFKDGRWDDQFNYSILKEEWKGGRSNLNHI
ncbi:MAG: N-acetyltransferase [Anaerocolumna sp.]|jgi:ribosomal-protein-alanine N-acetyltransferase|nr:N-acetyltransferase [Anaerocolumna sp.]